MSLTDFSYFNGELSIPNTDDVAVQQNLQWYIDQYEPQYLKILLGDTLYAAFIAGITPVEVEPATDPITFEPIDPKWTNLLNVIQLISGSAKISPIANYVYFYFLRRGTYSNSGTGVMTQPKMQNAVVIDSKIECARAWNQMNKLSFTIYKWLKQNAAIYGPLPYDLRFYNDDYLYYWFDWTFWWGWFPFMYRRCIPEIYLPINANGI